jgi:hypothetical protein
MITFNQTFEESRAIRVLVVPIGDNCMYDKHFETVSRRRYALTHSLTHSHAYSLTRSHPHSLTLSLTHTHPYSLTHSLTHSLTPLLTHSHPYSLTHTLTHSLTHSLTQSLNCINQYTLCLLRSLPIFDLNKPSDWKSHNSPFK